MEDFAEVLAEMARTFRAQPDLESTLQATVDLAAAHLPGLAEVSVTLIEHKHLETGVLASGWSARP